MKKQARFEVFESEIHQNHWHWRLIAANGEIVASGEGFTRKASATRAVNAVKRAVRQIADREDRARGIEWTPVIRGAKGARK